MVEVPVTIACGNYDRHRASSTAGFKVEGCAVTYCRSIAEEIFFRTFRYQEFDVAEMSFSSYLRNVRGGYVAYVGLPAFVSAIFRHSGIYVRADAGIRSRKTCAVSASACPNIRSRPWSGCAALMQHEYGVSPNEICWRSGGRKSRTR